MFTLSGIGRRGRLRMNDVSGTDPFAGEGMVDQTYLAERGFPLLPIPDTRSVVPPSIGPGVVIAARSDQLMTVSPPAGPSVIAPDVFMENLSESAAVAGG